MGCGWKGPSGPDWGPSVSVEAARRLFERARSDPDFLFRIALIEDPEERTAVLAAEGFDCTTQEIADVCMQPFAAQPPRRPSSAEPQPQGET